MPAFLSFLVVLSLILMMSSGCTDHPQDNSAHTHSNNSSMFSALNAQDTQLAEVQPGYNVTFPGDHSSHPEFAIEWWYVTANLTDENNNAYALQWTLFRAASDNQTTPWSNGQQFMGHVALKTQGKSWFEEKFARGAVGNAGVTTSPFNAFIDDWQWLAESDALFPSVIELNIEEAVSARLRLNADTPFILHGDQGYSVKLRNAQQASYYYSQPNIKVTGEIALPEGRVSVSGQAWYDHEWTSSYLTAGALGWDWFSVHLDSGEKLMLFNMRHQQQLDYWSGTLVTAQNQSIHLREQDIMAEVSQKHDLQGKILPLNWSIKVPKYSIDIAISPMQIKQWNPGRFAYYEGGTIISGSHTGVGFIELTGY